MLFFVCLNLQMIKKYYNIFEFYKSTYLVNFAMSLCAFLLSGSFGFMMTFATIGLITSLAIKEINNKSEYNFYRNNGVSKMELWLFSFVFNLIFIALIQITIYLF